MINQKKKNTNQAVNVPGADNTGKVLKPAIIKSAVALIVLVAMLAVYFLLPADYKNALISGGEQAQIVLLDGEVKLSNSTIYVFEPLSSSDLRSIEVQNTNCSFSLTKADEGSGFYLDGNEQLTYSDEAFSTLIVATCNTVTSERVYPDLATGQGPDVINYASFGLDEANMNARYTITTTRGEKYTVRVGNLAPNGKGYYACLEGREAVYILNDDLQNTVLGTVESIVNPDLGLQSLNLSTTQSYTIEHFTVWHSGKHIASIHSVSDEDASMVDSVFNFAMSCNQDISADELMKCDSIAALEDKIGIGAIPYNYIPVIDEFNAIAGAVPNLTGEETVALKDPEIGAITAEQLLEFGIDAEKPAYEIFYTTTVADEQSVYNHVIFSEKVDGYYYAFSEMNKLIAKVPEDSVYFLDWDYSQWTEPNFFQKYINSVAEIKIKSDTVDYAFKLNHGADDEGTANLVVTESGNILDTENFRRFYRVLLSRKLRGSYDGEIPGEDKLYLTLTVTNTEGNTTEYKFYNANTQQTFMTTNGQGEFYCLASAIRKLENDAAKLIAGETVNFEDWN